MATIVEDFRKVLQDLLTPELRDLRGEIKLLSERLQNFEESMNARFNNLERMLNLDRRMSAVERLLEEKKEHTQ